MGAGAAALELQMMAAEGAGSSPSDVERRLIDHAKENAVANSRTERSYFLQIQPAAPNPVYVYDPSADIKHNQDPLPSYSGVRGSGDGQATSDEESRQMLVVILTSVG